MATPRKSKFEKALTRALRLQTNLLFAEEPDDARFARVNKAWQTVAELHGPCGGAGVCEWCDRFPPLFDFE